MDYLTAPRDTTCLAASAAHGAAIGAVGGGIIGGLSGAALGAPTGGTASVPLAIGGAAEGASVVGQAGFAVGTGIGFFSCSTGGGGGGVGGKVRFGNNANQEYHAFRHVEEEGISKDAAEDAIRADLAGKEDALPQGLTKGQVDVGGRTLDYHAYKLPDGTINVGRITVR